MCTWVTRPKLLPNASTVNVKCHAVSLCDSYDMFISDDIFVEYDRQTNTQQVQAKLYLTSLACFQLELLFIVTLLSITAYLRNSNIKSTTRTSQVD